MDARRFVTLFASLFGVFFLGTLCFSYVVSSNPELPHWMRYFVAANLLFYAVGALGLFGCRLFGFYALKVFLYVLLLSFPIGTLIAVRILRYMKRQGVRSLFR